MDSGIYLLRINGRPPIVKVGRSDQLCKRLDYWKSHGLQVVYRQQCSDVESHLLEYGLIRANRGPTESQVTAFSRRQPMFPLNNLGLPQGSSEWVISDPRRMIQQVEFLMPLVSTIAAQIGLDELHEGRSLMKHYVARADGLVDVVGRYCGPLVLA